MKKLLLASMIAMASAFAIAPANAGSLQLGIGVGPGYDGYYNDDYSPYYRHHRYYRHVYNDEYDNGGYVVRYHHRRHCRTELVSHWRHHHRVVEEVRVCGHGYNND
jgi:flavin-dependent dehydrogenase